MLIQRSFLLTTAATLALLSSAPAQAGLPDPVREMVEAAIASGDAETIEAVITIARQTNPDDLAELDAMRMEYDGQQADLAKAAAEAQEQAIRSASLLDNWSGNGEIGAFRASGNSDNVGGTVRVKLKRTGIDWEHRITAQADYQRSNGTTTREQFLVAYEPRYQINPKLFAYALGQLERDRFQGFTMRYSGSAGLGYRVIDTSSVQLSVKAGPAWRKTKFVGGASESSLAALAGLDFDWAITDRLKLTQDANMLADASGSATIIVDAANTSVNLVTGLEAKVSDRLTTRLSYAIEYDSNPPAAAVSTDTLSRFTLVYGF